MSDNKKQVELAIETLAVFTQHGEDLSEERHVVHYFYDGNHVALGEALRELGYQVRPTVNQDGVVAERHDAIDEEWRTTTLANLAELADTYGSDYDGWEAAMTRQPAPEPEPSTNDVEPSSKKPGLLSRIFGKKN